MSTHKTYREITNSDIKNIYAGHNSDPPKLASGFASRYFGTRLLQTLFSTHAKPTDAFQWNCRSDRLPRIATSSAGPAFRTFDRYKIDQIIDRLRRPTASSGKPARGRDRPDASAAARMSRTSDYPRYKAMTERRRQAVVTRVAGTHTHVTKMAAERDVNRMMKEINNKIPSDSVYFLRIK